jgi:ABC-type multidrug transport system ATPase subunit
MLETIFTTEFEQGPIPAGFHIHLEGDFIVLIGPNNSGKTSLLHALLRKNIGEKTEEKTQVCLINTGGYTHPFAQASVPKLEQYIFDLFLNREDRTKQVQKLKNYLEYLGLAEYLQKKQDAFPLHLRNLFSVLAALIDDNIRLLLIDEPEIHLHPSLQKRLMEIFYESSKEKRIVIATHSNVFANKQNYTSNYFISRDNNKFSILRAYSEHQLEAISLAEIKLVKALTKAVPSIGLDLLTSLNIEKLYMGMTENTSQTTDTIQEKREEINITIFYEELKGSIKYNKDTLAKRHQERVQQTNITYYVSLTCLLLGILLVFVGIILIFADKLEGGVLTTISSAIISIVSGLAFVFNKQANDLEREDTKQMRTLGKSYEAMGYISTLTDEKKKDELIEKLVEKLLFENQAN